MVGTFWAFMPAVFAILLALITKQVYMSLFTGIFIAAMFISGGEPLTAVQNIFTFMAEQFGSNGGILIFLVILGIFSVLLVKSGGSNAYSQWAYLRLKTKKGACLSAVGLACVFSVDDYFSCMALGQVMRPITDKNHISHSKLAYLIHSCAAPICIMAPISSWAAAISGYTDEGLLGFLKAIPLNLYAILAIGLIIAFSIMGIDLFKMKRDEKMAEDGDLDAGETDLPVEEILSKPNTKGKVYHLVIPVIMLVVCCVGFMFFNGWKAVQAEGITSFTAIDLLSYCDSSIALAAGSAIALFFTIVFYICTGVITFKDAMDSFVEGFKSMVPAMLILVFAWTLSEFMGAKGAGLDEYGHAIADGTLNAKAFVLKYISTDSMAIGIIPFLFFLLACLLAFATGTSWGTFGVLIPIATAVIPLETSSGLYYLAIAAVLAGAVFGDNTSPISDTTIMAASSAHCNAMNHVKTQLPYACMAAIVASVSYLIGGFCAQNPTIGSNYGVTVAITLGSGLILFAILLVSCYFLYKKEIPEKVSAAFDAKFGKYFKRKKKMLNSKEIEEEDLHGEINISDEVVNIDDVQNVDEGGEING